MAFQPQPPFPKSRGDMLRSTDWNDLVGEVQRLDNEKVNRSGDKIGPLSVTGSLAVGGTANDDIPLQVQSSAANRSPLAVLGTPNNEDFLSLFGGRRNSQLPFVAWKRGDLRVGTAATPDGAGLKELLRINSSDTAAARVEIDGRVRAGQAMVGPWPSNPAGYAFFGATSLDQTQSGNYAVLQGTGSDNGTTYVNSSVSLRLRIGNADRLVIQNNGNIDIVPPSNLSFGNLTRQMINLWSNEYGIGVQASTVYFRTGNHFAWYRGSGHNDNTFHPGNGGRTLMRLDVNGNLFIRGQIFQNVNFNDPNIIIGPIIDPIPIITPSDARLKRDIVPLTGALDRLLQLRGVTFAWDATVAPDVTPAADDEPQIGFIAQEVEQVFPQWVRNNGDGYKHLSIRGFEALAIEALRELRERVRVLEADSGLENGLSGWLTTD
jgi:hypothetical protein